MPLAEPPLRKSTLAAFAAPAAPIAGLGLPLVVYLPPFYADDLGLGLALVGALFMVARFWDVATDPVLGMLSDRFASRWGRRRHWIVASVPIVMLSVYMLFLPARPVSGAYLLAWLVFLYVGWTLLTISHLSWAAELTADYHERSRVQGWREVFLLGGMVAVLALPAAVEGAWHGASNAARVATMGWFILVLLPPTVAWAVARVPERPGPETSPLGWQAVLHAAVRSAPLRRILLVDVVSGFGGGVVAALFVFLGTDALGLGGATSSLLLCYFLAGTAFVPVMLRLSYRFGKHRTVAGSAIFNAVALPLLYAVPHGNLPAAFGLFVLFGVNMSVGPILFRSMMADVADHDCAVFGGNRMGLYFALLAMTHKVGHAFSIGVVYPALAWFGYVAGGENEPAAVARLVDVYVWVPVLCSLLVAAVVWNFPLGRTELERLKEERA